jgi:hypothetical protein
VAEDEAAEVDEPAPKKRRGISVNMGKPCEGDSDEDIVVRIKPMRRYSSPTSRFLCGRCSRAQFAGERLDQFCLSRRVAQGHAPCSRVFIAAVKQEGNMAPIEPLAYRTRIAIIETEV